MRVALTVLKKGDFRGFSAPVEQWKEPSRMLSHLFSLRRRLWGIRSNTASCDQRADGHATSHLHTRWFHRYV
jgi:hypothetical protein